MENKVFTKCLLCAGTAELKEKQFPGFQEPETFEIYHCVDCGTAFSLPRVETTKMYENIYKSGSLVPGYNRYWKYAHTVKSITNPLEYLSESEETYWGVKEALSLFVSDKRSAKILEIGSGLGYLTYSLIKENYNIFGIDISHTAVKRAIELFGEHYLCVDLFEFASFNAELFDMVILTEVIEHVDNPLHFIESIIKLLKPGGRIIMTTPNKSIYPSNIIWATELPPIHYWWFSENSIEYIAKKLNVNFSLVNFYKYYKKNYRLINLKLCFNNIRRPTFNINNDLIIAPVKRQNFLKAFLVFLVYKIPFVKTYYRKLKELINPNIIVCRDKGIIMCSILQKKFNC